MSESQEQAALVKWFKMAYPKYEGCIIGQANGSWLAGDAKSRAIQARKLKSTGVKNGTSDLFISVARGGKHGLWVEMKDQGKTWCSVSKGQRQHIEDMLEQGYEAIWASGFDIARAAVTTYMEQSNDQSN